MHSKRAYKIVSNLFKQANSVIIKKAKSIPFSHEHSNGACIKCGNNGELTNLLCQPCFDYQVSPYYANDPNLDAGLFGIASKFDDTLVKLAADEVTPIGNDFKGHVTVNTNNRKLFNSNLPSDSPLRRRMRNISTTTSSQSTCSNTCPLRHGKGCYAAGGPLKLHWDKVSSGERGKDIDAHAEEIARIPPGNYLRVNQAGDLPGDGNKINANHLGKITEAATVYNKIPWTYTAYDMSDPHNREQVKKANDAGFTINLSSHSLAHADDNYDLGIAPVVSVVPSDQLTNFTTPKGRKVVICPAETPAGEKLGMSCSTCGMCANKDRSHIIGFPAHGTKAKQVSKRIKETNETKETNEGSAPINLDDFQ